MLNKILHDANAFKQTIAELKLTAPIYPEIEYSEQTGCIFANTMVEFIYNGVRFKRHHVESIVLTDKITKEYLVRRINEQAKLCQEKAIPCSFDDVIGLK